MSTYRLETLFAPRSVAIVGGSPRQTSTGRAVLDNLLGSGFPGAIYLVNPHYDEIEGVRTVKSYDAIAGDARRRRRSRCRRPRCRTRLRRPARKGTAAAIIITAGLGHGPGSLAEVGENECRTRHRHAPGRPQLSRRAGAAAQSSMRASRRGCRRPGDLALISQSGAIVGRHDRMGGRPRRSASPPSFSIGDQLDVDFGDLLDLLRRWIAAPAPSCSISSRSRTRASSCRRRVPRHAPSR